MSDFEIRRLERKYRESGSPEDADRLITALLRLQRRQPVDPEFSDMEICSYWLGNLPGFEDGEDVDGYVDTPEYQDLTNWIERNASFSYVRSEDWEHMVYVGRFDHDNTPIATGYHYPGMVYDEGTFHYPVDPTPPLLIPIIERAVAMGCAYVSFHASA